MFICRQYTSALADLTEALKIAPDNRELRHLIARVKEESRDASRSEPTSNRSPVHPPGVSPGGTEAVGGRGIPDIVPTTPTAITDKYLGVIETERRKEETAL